MVFCGYILVFITSWVLVKPDQLVRFFHHLRKIAIYLVLSLCPFNFYHLKCFLFHVLFGLVSLFQDIYALHQSIGIAWHFFKRRLEVPSGQFYGSSLPLTSLILLAIYTLCIVAFSPSFISFFSLALFMDCGVITENGEMDTRPELIKAQESCIGFLRKNI